MVILAIFFPFAIWMSFYPAFVVRPHTSFAQWMKQLIVNSEWKCCSFRGVGAEVPHPPAVYASLLKCTAHPKAQLGPAHICSTWSLCRAMVNHRGWQQLHCHYCLETQSNTPNSFYTLCMVHVVIMDCVLEDTREIAALWLCLIDRMKE